MKKDTRSARIFRLFLTFMKIGVFTFGGGYAMIPLIQREISEKKKWISNDDILEVVAIAESTPGPIAVNSATFVGYKVGGFLGAFAATLGLVIPSFVIIIAIAALLNEFQSYKVVRYAFYGIRTGVLALIIKALISMYKQYKKNAVAYVVMALSFVLVAIFDVNVLIVIILCALIGLISSIAAERKLKK